MKLDFSKTRKVSVLVTLLFICYRPALVAQTAVCNACVGGSTNGLSGVCSYDVGYILQYPLANTSSWNLIFEEEWDDPNMTFDGPNALWDASIKICSSFDNNTVFKRANLIFNNGIVNLQTKYEPNSVCDYLTGNPPVWQQQYRNYTVPSLHTNIHFGPGKFEIRCKIPKIAAQWPAFWLFHAESGSPYHGQEIDVFEFKQDAFTPSNCTGGCVSNGIDFSKENEAGRRMIMTSHYDGTNNSVNDACVKQMCYYSSVDLSEGFHTYALVWDEDYLEWFLDGQSVYKRNRILHQYVDSEDPLRERVYHKDLFFPDPKVRMGILLGTGVWNTVSHYDNNNCGSPLTPNDFLVDYVRVWERSCGTGNRTLNYTYDPDYFYDRNNAVVKAQNIYFENNAWPKWELNAGQKLKTGATDEIKIVNFEAKLGSEFVATITNCGNLSYRKSSDQQVLTDTVLTKEQTSLVNIVPNPNNGSFQVVSDSDINQLDIYDMNGKMLLSLSDVNKNEVSIVLNQTNCGLCVLRIIDNAGNVHYRKVLIN